MYIITLNILKDNYGNNNNNHLLNIGQSNRYVTETTIVGQGGMYSRVLDQY